jgi:alanine or glycine:cation symporter, AGCS family
MRKILFTITLPTLIVLSFSSVSAEAAESNFEESINGLIEKSIGPYLDVITDLVFFEIPLGDGRGIPFVIVWLLIGAAFFTYYMRFINFRGFRHAIDIVRGRFDDPKDPGEVSHFQALTAALSGTVGLGNIAGVAIAVSVGGAGATFWMIIAGLLGMTSKFVECTLGVKYRDVHEDNTVSGGPMYYLTKGLKKKGLGNLGKILAVLFAIFCIGGSFGGGNMAQINQATEQFVNVTGGESSFLFGREWIFGLVMAIIVGMIILGGIKSIVKVTDKVVPFMVGIYMISALVVIFIRYEDVPSALTSIFVGAFAPQAMFGGFVGVLIQGFRRAAFSNEAGVGSASIAHSAAKTEEPISEGIVALLEPFIDTVVVCTMTALVIIITNHADPEVVKSGLTGVQLTSSAFESTISWFPYLLSVAVILFGFSTMISWSYYGLKSWTFLFGESKSMDILYKVLFCSFVVIGSALNMQKVFGFSDAMIFAMAFPNVIGLYLLAPEIKQDLGEYLEKVKSGVIKKFW